MKPVFLTAAVAVLFLCSAAGAQQASNPDDASAANPAAPAATGDDIDWSTIDLDVLGLTSSLPERNVRAKAANAGALEWSRNGDTLSVKKPLAAGIATNIGVDRVAAPSPSPLVPADLLPGTQQAGAAWASAAIPGDNPLLWDQATVSARFDPAHDQSKLGTSISKSLPLGDQFSLTVQNGYSVSQTLAAPSAPGTPTQVTEAGQTAKINLLPTGTSLIAGTRLSSADERWLNSIGAEQTFGAISLRATVSETATGEADRSLTAGFKRSW